MDVRTLLHRLHPLPPRAVLTECHGSAATYALARLWSREAHRPFCVLTATSDDAARWATDCAFFVDADRRSRILPFPAPDGLPYRPVLRSPDVTAARLCGLHMLCHHTPNTPLLIVAPIAAVLAPTLPIGCFRDYLRTLHQGEALSLAAFRDWLAEAGYMTTPVVEDVGTMAVRGGIIDCWPPSAAQPIRIELDGETIGSIRAFDPVTQRSEATCAAATIGPAAELLLTTATQARAAAALRRRADAADLPAPARRPIMDAISQGRRPPLLATFLPILYEHPGRMADYLPPETLIVCVDPAAIAAEATAVHQTIHTAWESADAMARLIPPDECSSPFPMFTAAIAEHPHVWIGSAGVGPFEPLVPDKYPTHGVGAEPIAHVKAALAPPKAGEDPLTPMAEFLRQAVADRYRIVIACHTALAADRTVDLFRWHGLNIQKTEDNGVAGLRSPGHQPFSQATALTVTVGALSAGFRWPEARLLFLTEEELFGAKIARRPPKRPPPSQVFFNFHDLEPGDYLVHEQHGIGRFGGLQTMTIHQVTNEYITVEYLGGDKLYVPIYRLHLLQRYLGAGEQAPVCDRLGGARWGKATARALQSIRVMANDLLKIYAARQLHRGTAFGGRDHLLEEFEAAFPYDETPDQWQAIEETLSDMQAEKPMDRLICGDVGYGKTEIALRAAFRVALDGKQVAVLVPTTLLAFQHYQTFAARFAATPVRVEMCSRFRSRAEQAAVLADLATGAVDIVIGTHRLLQKDVTIPRLGLLVVDEEQHFGVVHKERLRKLRATVDTLTLTATPIPRTLHMALAGLRDVSIIQTPPADRQAIRTYIVPFDDRVIREAIGKELARGGEVFFVHNRVQTIGSMRDHLQQLVPEARMVVAHGQMAEDELEAAMLAFVRKEANLLLCTSIIESGLDIPAANTILVNRADTFGLAQLYQIRGRVGRASVQAACYLLTPPEETIPPAAQKRLATLARFTELGSGFSIAMHDLELRGAGNLLGGQQSGHIAAIGYEMFTRLLEQTIRRLRGEPEGAAIDVEITLPIPAYLPEAYVSDVNARIVWYKRLSTLETPAELDEAGQELADRFGPLPESAQFLLRIIAMKQMAKTVGIDQIHYDKGMFAFRFHSAAPIDLAKLLAYVAKHKATHALRPSGVLAIRHPCPEAGAVLTVVQDYLTQCRTACLPNRE